MPRQLPSRRAQRAVLLAVLGAVAMGGVALLVGGAVAARDTTDASGVGPTASTTSSTLASTTTPPPTTGPPTTTATMPAGSADDGTLELGQEGEEVRSLQARLDELGYWHGASDGHYGQLTRQAVMAFQKAGGLGRDGVAGPATRAALATTVRPAPQDPSGSHVEVDLARQILLVVEDGQTRWVLNTSTGSGEVYASGGGGTSVAATPPGRFQVEREIDGLRQAPLGTLYRPKYFNGGIAIHGAGEIPVHPASHGCVRVTNAAMDLLWSSGVTRIGTGVLVY